MHAYFYYVAQENQNKQHPHTCFLKVVLHAAIFRAASLATPLRDMLHESLQRVTPLATVKIDAKLAATNVAESRIGFYFSQRLQQLFLALQRVTPPLQQVSQCCGF